MKRTTGPRPHSLAQSAMGSLRDVGVHYVCANDRWRGTEVSTVPCTGRGTHRHDPTCAFERLFPNLCKRPSSYSHSFTLRPGRGGELHAHRDVAAAGTSTRSVPDERLCLWGLMLRRPDRSPGLSDARRMILLETSARSPSHRRKDPARVRSFCGLFIPIGASWR
jgi:hypothetical protein